MFFILTLEKIILYNVVDIPVVSRIGLGAFTTEQAPKWWKLSAKFETR